MQLERREMLRGLSAVSLTALQGCAWLCPPGPSSSVNPAANWIDIHCHVFNARDIPIVGFVTDVVMEGIPIAPELFKPLIVLIALIMDSCAWPADTEAKAIQQNRGLQAFAATQETMTMAVQTAAANGIETFRQKSGRYQEFGRLADEYLEESGRRTSEAADADHDADLLQYLVRRGGVPADKQALLASPQATGLAAGGATAINDEIKGTFYLAYFLTRRRLELVERLSSLPAAASDADSIALYCPAMVDYSYWLHESVTNLHDQVTVMSAIASLKGRSFAVHPWISFCPWRQIEEHGQLAIVQDAVRTKGFIGVKLYPVMGFRPYGNATSGDTAKYPKPLASRLADLDGALAQLYDWCVREDVPIMAHCSYSQFPNKDAGLRGAPEEWRKVFSRPAWKNLRVNLGHIGGIWDLKSASNNGWVADAVALTRTFPNVFADVSDDADAVELGCGGGCPGTAEADRLTAILDKPPEAGMTFDPRKKIMYGTDWVMLSRDLHTDAYLDGLRKNLAERVRVQLQDFFGMNAARFLGLDRTAGPYGTVPRLLAFYRSNGLPMDFLNRWQA